MKNRDTDVRMQSEFAEALRLRDAGEVAKAVQILRRLAEEAPDRPSILGTLAGLEYQAGDYESAVATGRAVILMSPRSGLASVTLFHSLNRLGKTEEALAEMTRFRTGAYYSEYDKRLSETYDDALRRLDAAPNDARLRRIRDALHAEILARPVRH